MGSTESTVYEIPKSTHENIYNRSKQNNCSSTNVSTTQQDKQNNWNSPNVATTQQDKQHNWNSPNVATTQQDKQHYWNSPNVATTQHSHCCCTNVATTQRRQCHCCYTNIATTQHGQRHCCCTNVATTQHGQRHCCCTNVATTQHNVAPSRQFSATTTRQHCDIATIKHNSPIIGCQPSCFNAPSTELYDSSYHSTSSDDSFEYPLEKLERYPNVPEKPSVVKITSVTEKSSVAEKKPVVTITKERELKSLIKPPNKLNNLDDFITNWNVWKEQLTSFLELTDEKRERYHEWGSYFLHFMGPAGQQILQDLFFNNETDKKCYGILMQKYNSFYKFTTAVKSENETVEEYIEKWKSEAAQNIKNVDKTLKEKIAKEIEKQCKHRFTALAKSKFSNFKFETTFDSLTLTEIAFLWKICEEFNFNSNGNCKSCGSFHRKEKCAALGNECAKCKRMNHFSRYCPGLGYITNCSFCGGNHQLKHCPAYGEICSKCGRLNHFSWKCSTNSF